MPMFTGKLLLITMGMATGIATGRTSFAGGGRGDPKPFPPVRGAGAKRPTKRVVQPQQSRVRERNTGEPRQYQKIKERIPNSGTRSLLRRVVPASALLPPQSAP